jgi:hypothetical protein
MDRRSFLGLATAFIIKPTSALASSASKVKGWIPGHYSQRPSFYKVSNLYNFGRGKTVRLWKAWEMVTGRRWHPYFQARGDCVAQGAGGGLDILTAVQIAIAGKNEKFVAPSSRIAIYAGGRNFAQTKSQLRSLGEGMMGSWAVEYLSEYGNLLKMPYPPYDLTTYSGENEDYWDRQGLAPTLLEEAKKHPLLNYAPVDNWEQMRDAVASNHPVMYCSTMGANDSRRDKDGFIQPSGTWYHCWLVAGIRDDNRPGALLINSHGPNFGSGPLVNDQPVGSVWVDAENIDKYIIFRDRGREYRDSYALSLYKGFERPEKDYQLW